MYSPEAYFEPFSTLHYSMGMYQLPNEVIQQVPPVEVASRVGEKDEKPHRRDNKAAAASGPGTATTDHQKTDGGSLTTPASSP